MENASKALIIAGSVLITIMIVAVAVYLFGRGKIFSNSVADKSTSAEISAFNAQFSTYQSNWDNGTTISDANKYLAPSSLNKISDVISAVNLAASVNYQNNYGYSYYGNDLVETINAVEVIVDMSSSTPSGFKSCYLVEPNANVKSNFLYANSVSDKELSASARSSRISNFSTSEAKSCNDFLKSLSETKLVTFHNSNYTLYKYYFKGEYSISSTTGKIDSLKFTLICDNSF